MFGLFDFILNFFELFFSWDLLIAIGSFYFIAFAFYCLRQFFQKGYFMESFLKFIILVFISYFAVIGIETSIKYFKERKGNK